MVTDRENISEKRVKYFVIGTSLESPMDGR